VSSSSNDGGTLGSRAPQEETRVANIRSKLMKAFTARAYGPIDEVVEESHINIPEPKQGELLIRVKACSLAPGDVRNLRGDCDLLGPKTPYTIGGDIAGVVVKIGPKTPPRVLEAEKAFEKVNEKFAQREAMMRKKWGELEGSPPLVPSPRPLQIKLQNYLEDKKRIADSTPGPTDRYRVGDRVCAMFDFRPTGGLAQYAIVKVKNAARIPPSLSFRKAAALSSSGLAAMLLAKTQVKPGDRVLVLGASGGVGTHLVQFLKKFGASYVAVTSTATRLMTSLGADDVIDYRTEEWSEIEKYQGRNRFDLIIDLVGTYDSWKKAKRLKVLKGGLSGGRYTTLVGDDRYMQIHSMMDVLSLMRRYTHRHLWTRLFWPLYPRYTWFLDGLEPANGNLDALLSLVDKREVKCVLDPASPFRFTLHSIKKALHLQESYRGKGKVVVDVH